VEEVAKAVAMLDRSGIGEVDKVTGSSGGPASPSINALTPLEGVDSIEVNSDLSL
jgi:hypothetical protein